jgi:hypothetical protein
MSDGVEVPLADHNKAIRSLLSAAAVRERAHEMLELALDGRVDGWRVDLPALAEAAERTAAVTRELYPSLDVPFHARWRHFVAGPPRLVQGDPQERARASFDLVILSVLLDAGSGPSWRYCGAEGTTFSRSEGLAVASQHMFESGAFAEDGVSARADGAALVGLAVGAVASGFQAGDGNPLVGLEGRTELLRRLGRQIAARPDLFGGRPGGLFDVLARRSECGRLPASAVLELMLEALGPIWAGRLEVDGVPLGDCWRHSAIRRDDASDGLVPLHKLSQWLSYSLIEPLQEAGIEVVEIDGLTGLAEYRNGGLFIDAGVLVMLDKRDAAREHQVGDPLIVAWRAMTVALLDRMAPLVRERLGVTEADFPLARMLEGGSWAAGRRIAAELRPGGGPPLNIISDGTVF